MIKNGLLRFSLLLLLSGLTLSSCSNSFVRPYSASKSKRIKAKKPRKYASRTKTKVRTTTVSSASTRKKLIKEANKYLGTRYTYGGKKPQTGFDCSGLSTYVYNQCGIKLSGSSKELSRKGKRKNLYQSQVGDLAFFGTDGRVTHVGIVCKVDNNQIEVIHSTSSKGVRRDIITESRYWKKKYMFSSDILN